MRTVVTVDIALTVSVAAEVVFSVVPATGWATEERLDLAADGHAIVPVEREDAHGTRLHRAVLPAGAASLTYRAEVSPPAAPATSDDLDPVRYLRPSRYVPSDLLSDEASAFVGLPPREIVTRVLREVAARLEYAPGSSGPTDSALDALRAGVGVCRDFAHVTIALLRASGVPARLVSAFAPGLDPMDFHAVVEAFVEGRWEVVDATRLAPRAHLARIATGRDAADTAFLTTISGAVALDSVEVTAVARGDLQLDDTESAVLLR